MEIINEGSEHTVRFDSYANVDASGNPTNPVIPASASYSVRCATTGVTIKNNISLAPSTQITIVFDALDSAILNSTNKTEEKVATIKTTGCNTEYRWLVKNLEGV